MTPLDLAREISDDPRERRELTATLRLMCAKQITELPDLDRDYTWFRINEYVVLRLGYVMAAHHELTAALQRQLTQRVLRQQSQEALRTPHTPRSLPRRTPSRG